MADQTTYPTAGGDAGLAPDRGSANGYPGTPRWVKASGIVVLALILLLVAATALGLHKPGGPGGHMPFGGGDTPPAAQGVQRP